MKVITPTDYRLLPWNKKVQLITVLYITKCTVIRGAEYKKNFFPLWQHFRKQEDSTLHLLYDYLFQCEYNFLLSLTELYKQSKLFAEKAKVNTDTQPQYKPYDLNDLEDENE